MRLDFHQHYFQLGFQPLLAILFATALGLASAAGVSGCADGSLSPDDEEPDATADASTDRRGDGYQTDGDAQEDVADVPGDGAGDGAGDGIVSDGIGDAGDADASDAGNDALTDGGDTADANDTTDMCSPDMCDPSVCPEQCPPDPCTDHELLGECYTVSQEVASIQAPFRPWDFSAWQGEYRLMGYVTGGTAGYAEYTRAAAATDWVRSHFNQQSEEVLQYVRKSTGEPTMLKEEKSVGQLTHYSVGGQILCSDWEARWAEQVRAHYGPGGGLYGLAYIDGTVRDLQLCNPTGTPLRLETVAGYEPDGGFDLRFDATGNPEVLGMDGLELLRWRQGLNGWEEEVLHTFTVPDARTSELWLVNHGSTSHVFAVLTGQSTSQGFFTQIVYFQVDDSGVVSSAVVSGQLDADDKWDPDTRGDRVVDAAISPDGVPYLSVARGRFTDRELILFNVRNGVPASTVLLPHLDFDTGWTEAAQIDFDADGNFYHLQPNTLNYKVVIRKYALVP